MPWTAIGSSELPGGFGILLYRLDPHSYETLLFVYGRRCKMTVFAQPKQGSDPDPRAGV
jgi:hypothetical protein